MLQAKTILYSIFGCILIIFSSCEKDLREEMFPVSLTVVNAINDKTTFMNVYFGETEPKYYYRLAFIENGKSLDYTTYKINPQLSVFLNHDTLSKVPQIKNRLTVESAGIYTHFIYGNQAQIKEKTVKEDLPKHHSKDTSAQLRIVNLFENRSIDVIQLSPVVDDPAIVSDLKYEQLSAFIRVGIKNNFDKFRFQIIDHETGDILGNLEEDNLIPGGTDFNPNWLFRPRSMLVTGTWTGAGISSAKVTTIGHF